VFSSKHNLGAPNPPIRTKPNRLIIDPPVVQPHFSTGFRLKAHFFRRNHQSGAFTTVTRRWSFVSAQNVLHLVLGVLSELPRSNRAVDEMVEE